VDIQMRTNLPHIFAIGNVVGQPMLAHKAVHEAHVAAEVIAGELQGNKELPRWVNQIGAWRHKPFRTKGGARQLVTQ
jgi:pyruvate/2-oxoglutarate dehydrogenase complex dihydrolipoamide dehydrogenase (E3) component